MFADHYNLLVQEWRRKEGETRERRQEKKEACGGREEGRGEGEKEDE